MVTPRALKFRLLLGLVSGLTLVWLAPGAGLAAGRTPLPVKAAELHPITFSRLIVRLEREDDIGLGKAEFRVRFLEELRALGYPAVGAESLMFDKDNSGEARFLLGGTITALDCVASTTLVRPTHGCEIAVLWEVMDADLDRVVYRVVTKHEIKRSEESQAALARELVMGA